MKPDAHYKLNLCLGHILHYIWMTGCLLPEVQYNKAASESGTSTVYSAGLLKVTCGTLGNSYFGPFLF